MRCLVLTSKALPLVLIFRGAKRLKRRQPLAHDLFQKLQGRGSTFFIGTFLGGQPLMLPEVVHEVRRLFLGRHFTFFLVVGFAWGLTTMVAIGRILIVVAMRMTTVCLVPGIVVAVVIIVFLLVVVEVATRAIVLLVLWFCKVHGEPLWMLASRSFDWMAMVDGGF